VTRLLRRDGPSLVPPRRAAAGRPVRADLHVVQGRVIAVEDTASYLHPGIDPIALTRATVYNLRSANGAQGGSTLTQQLARTLFLSNARTYGRKVKRRARGDARDLSDQKEILELYFNAST